MEEHVRSDLPKGVLKLMLTLVAFREQLIPAGEDETARLTVLMKKLYCVTLMRLVPWEPARNVTWLGIAARAKFSISTSTTT